MPSHLPGRRVNRWLTRMLTFIYADLVKFLNRLHEMLDGVIWLNVLSVLLLTTALAWSVTALLLDHRAPLDFQILLGVASITLAVLGQEH